MHFDSTKYLYFEQLSRLLDLDVIKAYSFNKRISRLYGENKKQRRKSKFQMHKERCSLTDELWDKRLSMGLDHMTRCGRVAAEATQRESSIFVANTNNSAFTLSYLAPEQCKTRVKEFSGNS